MKNREQQVVANLQAAETKLAGLESVLESYGVEVVASDIDKSRFHVAIQADAKNDLAWHLYSFLQAGINDFYRHGCRCGFTPGGDDDEVLTLEVEGSGPDGLAAFLEGAHRVWGMTLAGLKAAAKAA